MSRFLIPLLGFVVLVVFLAIGLNLDPREVPSPFVDKAAPGFTLSQLESNNKTISPADLKGQVWLLNVWASWCVSCRQEHNVLMQLAARKEVAIYGLNYKDERYEARRLLKQRGNPYQVSAFDPGGSTGIDWGVYGVPETFVIDKNGIIRHKHTGPLNNIDIDKIIMPLVRELKGQPNG